MYTSHFHLGRFEVPEKRFGKTVEDWIPLIRYYAEPPIVTRGAMNPWAQERQRVLWEAEEKAWAEIQRLQSVWAKQTAEMHHLIFLYNDAVKTIENRMAEAGAKSPFQKMGMVGGVLSMTPFSMAGLIMTAMAAVDKVVGLITGKERKLKKDIENWMRRLEEINAEILALQQKMQRTEQLTLNQLLISKQVQSAQSAVVVEHTQQAEAAYQNRLRSAASQASMHRTLVHAAQSIPRKGMYDVL